MNKNYLLLLFSFCFVHLVIGQNLDAGLKIKLEKILKDKQIPGAMISVVTTDTTLIAGGIGFANIDTKELVNERHLFRLGSISKTIVAIGILKLVDQGKLNLTDKIKEIDPDLEIENKWEAQFPITVEQILEHTAGFDEIQKETYYSAEYQKAPSCDELVEVHKKSLYARWQPGERMAYANPGYVVAGYVLEKLNKDPYDKFLKEEILNPLGMQESGFFYKENEEFKTVEGYRRIGGQLHSVGFKSVQGGPASDLCSNANDMALFLKFMLSAKTEDLKQLISPELFDRMLKPTTSIAAKNGFEPGYGLGIVSRWTNNHRFYGHDGGIDGFSSYYLFSKEANLGLAISINSEADPWPMAMAILEFFLGPNTYEDSSTQIIPKEVKQAYEGFYNFKNPRNQSFHFIQKMFDGNSISFDKNIMIVKNFRGHTLDTLYHKGNNEFQRKDEGMPFVKLLMNKEKPVLWLGNHYAEKGSKGMRQFFNFVLFTIVFFSLLYFFIGGFWVARSLFAAARNKNGYDILLWLTSASLFFFIGSFIFVDEFCEVGNGGNFGSILLLLSSGVFFLAAILSFIKCFKLEGNSMVRNIYQKVTAFSLLALAIFCLSNGLMGITF